MMVVSEERESLLTTYLEDHQRAAYTSHVGHSSPQSVAYTSAQVPDVYASGDFKQPLRQMPTQSGWTSGKDNDGHQKSTWPMSA